MNRFALLAGILVLTGCAAPNVAWVKPNSTTEDIRRAQQECEQRSIQAAGRFARATLRDRRFKECMKEKGFHQVTGSSPAVTQKAAEKKIEKLEGKVTSVIDRSWQEGNTVYVLVTLKNQTKEVLPRVRIRCVALSKDGRRLNIGEEVVAHPSADFKKPLQPGQSKTARVSINLGSEEMHSTECQADW